MWLRLESKAEIVSLAVLLLVKPADLLRCLRLHHQWLARPEIRRPEEIVAHFGAVQSQDFGMAKWALALRGLDLTDVHVAAAFDAGAFLRTHVMRSTWHFVAPADIRWMLDLPNDAVLTRSEAIREVPDELGLPLIVKPPR